MKVYLLTIDDPRRKARVPYEGADHVVVDGVCPACGVKPFKAQGGNPRPSADDRAYEADAACARCGARVGTLRAEVDTLFGVREDERVLNGRCRVY